MTTETSEPKRDDPSDDAAGNWIMQALGPTLERVAREQAAAEEHVRTCDDRPCERCRRFVCPCGEPVIEAKTCRRCDDAAYRARLLKPTRDSIPSHFRWTFDATPALLQPRVIASPELVRRGLENPPSTSLLFMGPTGSGKTSLAVAMLDAWVRAEPGRRTGAFFVEAGWLARARARHRLGADEAPLVADALRATLLVLDDLGNEREDRDGCITDIVYGRANADLPTWVTCGLSTKEQTMDAFAAVLARRYDGGFVRRVLETSKRVQLGTATR